MFQFHEDKHITAADKIYGVTFRIPGFLKSIDSWNIDYFLGPICTGPDYSRPHNTENFKNSDIFDGVCSDFVSYTVLFLGSWLNEKRIISLW